jgi:mannose-1-phosphate guanylyltransferase/phosphomannomutase
VSLSYFVEDQPLGTAGSVKLAERFLTEPFVILSGDGLTDCDLTGPSAFTGSAGALATMVLKKVENPLEYAWSWRTRRAGCSAFWKSRVGARCAPTR